MGQVLNSHCKRESTFTVSDEVVPKRKSIAIGMVADEYPFAGRFNAIVQKVLVQK